MVIRSVRHRGLRGLLENDDPRILRSGLVPRVRRILTVPILAEDIESFTENAPRGWRFHRLSGGRKHEWSVWVSGNWRTTFAEADGQIDRLNLEDYH
ncbi:MAG: type II toxin-antitoxin system RelE/ParE family toxin [Bryobacterales bacterium]|nr:type II toxin-antitoxin system RelE/ParE family toxin [Bryobacterales bacterium]